MVHVAEGPENHRAKRRGRILLSRWDLHVMSCFKAESHLAEYAGCQAKIRCCDIEPVSILWMSHSVFFLSNLRNNTPGVIPPLGRTALAEKSHPGVVVLVVRCYGQDPPSIDCQSNDFHIDHTMQRSHDHDKRHCSWRQASLPTVPNIPIVKQNSRVKMTPSVVKKNLCLLLRQVPSSRILGGDWV